MGLFKPAWMTDKTAKTNKAIAAVEKTSDQATLVDAACNAPLAEVRIAAIERIEDQGTLMQIMADELSEEVRKVAFGRIDLSRMANRGQLVELAALAPTQSDREDVFGFLDTEGLWEYFIGIDDRDFRGSKDNRRLAKTSINLIDPDWLYGQLQTPDSRLSDVKKVAVLESIIDRVDDKDRLLEIAKNRGRLVKLEGASEARSWHVARCKALGLATGDAKLYNWAISGSGPNSETLKAVLEYELYKEPELAEIDAEQDESALRAVFQDEGRSIEHRIAAAKRLWNKFGDRGPYEELAAACTETKGHLLFQTDYVFWERQESICIRCLKRGGSYESDDGHTRHFGCLFWRERCIGDIGPVEDFWGDVEWGLFQ